MIVLHEKIDVARPINEAFAYISDFRTAQEWDATAFAASKLTPGKIGVGTEFEVACKLPVGSVTLLYTVTRLEPDRCIELHGRCSLFEVTDVIQFDETASGTHIDYRASFNFKGVPSSADKIMQAGMKNMGREALQGMKAALDDNYAKPTIGASNRRADKLVLPGLARFSRLGYSKGRKTWNPISAYMGDKHAVITGANAGLGLATAYRLADMGAELTLVIRKEERAKSLVDEIRRETGNDKIHVEIADLSLMADVKRLTQRLKRKGKPIDVLINNAGALFNPWGETSEGLEQSFALLLLSPYRLTEGLKPLLKKAATPRVINVVSGGMYSQQLEVKKLIARPEGYSGSVAYARAKRALMVMTEEWGRDWAEEGITVNAMHPGWADTPGVESALPGFHKLTKKILRSPEEGADTIIWLAAATEAGKVSGELFLDREPRTAYLLSSKEEDEGERARLTDFLSSFSVAAHSSSQESGGATLAY
ncbi:MAG: SDR family NAD(P)-dependent oxidoreductase [Halieaceae bacterium]